MAKMAFRRKYMTRNEVMEKHYAAEITSSGIFFETYGNAHRVWIRPLGEGAFGRLDYRDPREALPRGSRVVFAYGGRQVDGEIFTAREVAMYCLIYHLEEKCVFENHFEVTGGVQIAEPSWNIRLYMDDPRTRLPYLYQANFDENGKVIIPLEGGDEIHVAEGERFVGMPKGTNFPTGYRAALQDTKEWIDFDNLVTE